MRESSNNTSSSSRRDPVSQYSQRWLVRYFWSILKRKNCINLKNKLAQINQRENGLSILIKIPNPQKSKLRQCSSQVRMFAEIVWARYCVRECVWRSMRCTIYCKLNTVHCLKGEPRHQLAGSLRDDCPLLFHISRSGGVTSNTNPSSRRDPVSQCSQRYLYEMFFFSQYLKWKIQY